MLEQVEVMRKWLAEERAALADEIAALEAEKAEKAAAKDFPAATALKEALANKRKH